MNDNRFIALAVSYETMRDVLGIDKITNIYAVKYDLDTDKFLFVMERGNKKFKESANIVEIDALHPGFLSEYKSKPHDIHELTK